MPRSIQPRTLHGLDAAAHWMLHPAPIGHGSIKEVPMTTGSATRDTWLTIQEASGIMGNHMLRPDEIEAHYDSRYSRPQRTKLSRVPFDRDTLLATRDTHVLIPGYPISIRDMCAFDRDGHFAPVGRTFVGTKWYDGESFSREPVECRWQLLGAFAPTADCHAFRGLLPGSPEKSLLPRARDVVYLLTRYDAIRGKYLCDSKYLLCREWTPDGDVLVGFMDRPRIAIATRPWWDVGQDIYSISVVR